MRLKKLELDGFKSFGKKTGFQFEPGITAIVGPNGCGKSNIVDAFRWVLGITSAKAVRGKEMSDMIFDGGATGRAAPAAQVSLLFDNSDRFFKIDADEVEISRRLTRSGQSDYFLNGQKSKLKDFRRLFADTGIGLEAYSIIEQGKIDLILRTDPHERRKIFEEAAGINQFKMQRHEAELHLGRTEQNLAHVNAILDEIKSQVRRVKTQATKAEKYKLLTAQLRKLRITKALREYRELLERRENHLIKAGHAQRELTQAEEILTAERDRLQTFETSYDELERGLAECLRVLHEAEKSITARQANLTSHELRLQDIVMRRRRLQDAATIADSARDNLQRRHDEAQTEVDEFSRDLRLQEQKLHGLIGREQDVAKDIQARELASREARQAIDAATERCGQLTNDITAHDGEWRMAKDRLGRADQQRNDIARRLATADRRATDLAAQKHEVATVRDRLQTQLDAELADVKRLKADLDALTATRQHKQQRLTEATSRHATLDEVLAQRTDLAPGTRQLIEDAELRDRFHVRGLVSDLLIAPPEKAGVIEAILGPLAQSVVVATDRDAFAALMYLDEHGYGGANLIAESSAIAAAPARLDLGPLKLSDGTLVGLACDLVEPKTPDARAIVTALLGATVVVDDIVSAKELAPKLPAAIGLSTLNRDVLRKPAWFTGRPERTGLLTVRAELDKLAAEMVELAAELARIDAKIAEHTAHREEAEQRIEDLKQQALERSLELNDLETEEKHLRREVEEAEELRDAIDSEREDAQRSVGEIETRIRSLKTDLEGAKQRRDSLIATVAAGSDELLQKQRDRERLQSEISDERMAAKETSVRLENAQALLKDVAGQIERNDRELDRIASELDLLDEQEEESLEIVGTERAELEKLNAVASRKQSERAEKEQAFNDVRQRLAGTRRHVDDAVTRCEAARTALSDANHKAEVALERMNALRAHTSQELHADLDDETTLDALNDAEIPVDLPPPEPGETPDLFDQSDLRTASDQWITEQITHLQEKIQRLGAVNMQALDELAELEQKQSHLTEQQHDVLTALTEIRSILTDIENRTREMFLTTFAAIRENFARIFRKLFSGGSADVFLENPDEPLTSGIEIRARPPGSEPRTLTLLSGGQRTMIAIAMLFAIFEAKPSPFCILDEVDAALDDANKNRFGALLQDFVQRSQFLVITHSKATMAVADLLYGITMQQRGLSKRVHIRFEQVRETEHGEVEIEVGALDNADDDGTTAL